MTETEVLMNPFDVETHKKTFINYLEVVILENNGKILYAVPSHQELLIKLACEKHNVTRDELNDMCPPEYYFDFIKWLHMVSKAIPVWNEYYIGEPNEEQLETLKMLKREGLFKGNL